MKLTLTCFVIFLGQILIAQNYLSVALPPGQYKVGFRSSLYYDLGRPPLQEQLAGLSEGRAIHISVWYPARVMKKQTPMQFSQYVDDIVRMVNPVLPSPSARKKAIHLMNSFLSQVRGDSNVIKNHLPGLSSAVTTAFLDADPLSMPFPVVFYPESSYLSNIMSEQLASHGYIVVSVGRHGTLKTDFEWQSVKGVETLIQDGQFALAVIRKEFKTDRKIGVMGVGMNASAGLAWLMRNPEIAALASLEGGILTQYEFQLIQKSPYFDKTRANKPILVLHSPHEAINPDLISHYKYADRHILYLPGMSEFYYLNYGVWEHSIPGILGPSPGDTKKGFEFAAQCVVQFFDGYLKGKESGKLFYEKTFFANTMPPELVHYSFKGKIDIPPSVDELTKLLHEQGSEIVITEVQKHQKNDRQAFSFDTFIKIGQQLIATRKFEDGIKWAVVFQQSYPEATSALTMAGRCYLELGEKQKAHQFYMNSLRLLQNDPNFDTTQRGQLKLQIEKRLDELKG
jgi:hypothetical protein